jgi:hypothetical protein
MPTKLRRYLILVMALAFSGACRNVLMLTPASETQPVSNIFLAQTLVANPNYLDECKTLNPIKLTEQIPYQNILPGKTKESEVESILGMPDERSVFQGEINLVYGDTGLLVDIKNDVVTYIVVNPESKLPITLEEDILQYGCPDLFLAVNTMEDQVGYNSIRLIYSTIGLAVSFAGYPTSLGSSADAIPYFPPLTIQEYFETNGWAQMPFSAQPIEWNDAIK